MTIKVRVVENSEDNLGKDTPKADSKRTLCPKTRKGEKSNNRWNSVVINIVKGYRPKSEYLNIANL